MSQVVTYRPLTAEAGIDPRSVHVRLLMDEVALGHVFLSVLQSSPSVSFHQCSIPIHLSTTDTIIFFSQYFNFPVSSIPPMLHIHSFIYHRRCIMFFYQYLNFSVSIIPPMLHTHSFNYHQRCIIFFSHYFSFACQYHSTNVPYSFIHLPPTFYNVFLPVL